MVIVVEVVLNHEEHFCTVRGKLDISNDVGEVKGIVPAFAWGAGSRAPRSGVHRDP